MQCHLGSQAPQPISGDSGVFMLSHVMHKTLLGRLVQSSSYTRQRNAPKFNKACFRSDFPMDRCCKRNPRLPGLWCFAGVSMSLSGEPALCYFRVSSVFVLLKQMRTMRAAFRGTSLRFLSSGLIAKHEEQGSGHQGTGKEVRCGWAT